MANITVIVQNLLGKLKAQLGTPPAWSPFLQARLNENKVDPNYQWPEQTIAVLIDLLNAIPVGLTGHTGSGKSTLIAQIAAHCNWPLVRVNLNQQSTKDDIAGLWCVQDGSMKWIDGMLPMCRRTGAWLLLDEYDSGEPMILSMLHPVLEHDNKPVTDPTKLYFGTLCLKEKDGEVVAAQPSHRIMVTGNTLGQLSEFRHLYTGTQLTNNANLNRISLYMIGYLTVEQETELVAKVAGIAPKAAGSIAKVAAMVRKQFAEGTLRSPLSTRQVIDFSMKLKWLAPYVTEKTEIVKMAAESTILNKCNRDDAEAIWQVMKRAFVDDEA